MNLNKLTLLGLMCALFASSCQKNDSKSDPLGAIPPQSPSEVQAQYSPEAGTSLGSGSMNLTVPPGALPTATVIIAKTLTDLPEITNSNMKSAGIAYEFGPDGSEFSPRSKPILSFKYDKAYLASQGISEDNLVITYYHPEQKQYITEGGTVNKANQTVTVPVEHFTIYLLAANNPPITGATTVGAATTIPATPLIGSSLYVRSQITVANGGAVASAVLRHGNANDFSFSCATASASGSAVDTVMNIDNSLPAVPDRYSVVIPASLVNSGVGRRYCIRAVSTGDQVNFTTPVNAIATNELCSVTLNPVVASPPMVIAAGFSTQLTLSGTRRNIGCGGPINPVANIIPESSLISSPPSPNGAMGTLTNVGASGVQFNAVGPTLSDQGMVSLQVGSFSQPVNIRVTGGLLASIKILDNHQGPITNNQINISPNTAYDFDVVGKDIHGNTVLVSPTWSVTGPIGTAQSYPLKTLNTAGTMSGATGTLKATVGSISHTITVNIQNPVAPFGPACTSVTTGNARNTLYWCGTTGSNAYNVYFTTNGSDPSQFNPTATKIVNVQSPFLHDFLTNGTQYRYLITAVNGGGESSDSPTILSSTPSDNVAWADDFWITSVNTSSVSMKTDQGGNVYWLGYSAGNAYLRKFDPRGNLLWLKGLSPIATGLNAPLGAASIETVHLALDAEGYPYVVGGTSGSLSGANQGGRDLFVAKFNPWDGSQVWINQRGTPADDYATGVIVDGSSIYVVGSTDGDLDAQGNAGSTDIIVVKYDNLGNWAWTRQVGSTSEDKGTAIALSPDKQGLLITGYTNGALPGNVSAGGYDYFLMKYDLNGGRLWLKQRGNSSGEIALALTADNLGNIYVGGSTLSSLDGVVRTGPGENAFLVKFQEFSGNPVRIWTKLENGGTVNATYLDIGTDNVGNLYMIAMFYEAFVTQFATLLKYDMNGAFVYSKQYGPGTPIQETSVTTVGIDATAGYFYIGGHFRGTNHPMFNPFTKKYDLAGVQK